MSAHASYYIVICGLSGSTYFSILFHKWHDFLEKGTEHEICVLVFSTTFNNSLFITNLMHKFFILIHLLYSSTCFEHYYAHLQDNYISTASVIVTLFRWLFSTQVTTGSPLVTCVLNSHLKRATIPNAVLIQFVLLKMNTIVFETCRGI